MLTIDGILEELPFGVAYAARAMLCVKFPHLAALMEEPIRLKMDRENAKAVVTVGPHVIEAPFDLLERICEQNTAKDLASLLAPDPGCPGQEPGGDLPDPGDSPG